VDEPRERPAAAGPTLTLAVAARLLERSLDDLTLPQFRVLALIASSPERAGRIAARAGVSRPSLTGVLDGLEQRGLVRRDAVDGDRRGVSLEITADGRRALEQAQAATGARLGEVLDHLEPGQRADVLEGLALLGQAFETDGARRRATEVATR
jgi:DNA-binding MarR family transcriptional regulator